MMNALNSKTVHDVIGIGFGPSNLALAIALEELTHSEGRSLNSVFIEKQADYRWHGNTLVGGSEMQISFLKDLVSLRNPSSPYSFVNYLHRHGRLVDFINLGTFYPSRMEFNDYLCWVAGHFNSQAHYGEEVLRIEPINVGSEVDHLRVVSRDQQGREHARYARAVVVSSGGTPRIVEPFNELMGDPRVFHHAQYLSQVSSLPCAAGKPTRVAIVGSGQSAAEAFMDLHASYPCARVDMIVRGSALKPADDTPFVNDIFSPAYTDLVFDQPPQERRKLLQEYHNTNYSVVDPQLIERIYGILYQQKVSGDLRHNVLCRQQIDSARTTDQGIELMLHDLATDDRRQHRYDAVILATGYERRSHRDLLAPVEQHLKQFDVDRHYRALASPDLKAAVFLQGFCEASHGLSDTLLSVLPARSEEIGRALYALSETRRLEQPLAALAGI
ncbi:L-ornithine N5-oxygenase [Pseudomonas sp. JUb42]|jgi:L-ornithine N5-oxygenase|uniref:lysine N(6)-hydroxylase/L-ornithine N(5)-oxygenase family protein n=1 Tax=Pseudomonas sp. JUb42 TaxID=2940611 RepID=UPI0021695D6C|nr:lysine N(6)-hydroxylase/L-ornithine N(5)-oxygenase family protein [Pseudomonas sp. JUb42]MCS3472373.1 L-ornithine N5-oxygenase [Pseudomonas sp. JUb42]